MTTLLLVLLLVMTIAFGVALGMLLLERSYSRGMRGELTAEHQKRRVLARAVLSKEAAAVTPKDLLKYLREHPGAPVREAREKVSSGG